MAACFAPLSGSAAAQSRFEMKPKPAGSAEPQYFLPTNRQRKEITEDLAYARTLTENGPGEPGSLRALQGLYDKIPSGEIPRGRAELALCYAFGETLKYDLAAEWVYVVDSYAPEIVLSPVGKKLTVAPISMIGKRLDKHEPADLVDLRNQSLAGVKALISEGKVGNRPPSRPK